MKSAAVQKDGHTQFPAPLTSGATWNVTLLGEIGRAVGAEARSFGATECWAPILGLAREPRWGRTNEEFSVSPAPLQLSTVSFGSPCLRG